MGLRRHALCVRGVGRARRPSVHRGRPAHRPRHRQDDRGSAGTVVARGPAQSADQDSGDPGGPGSHQPGPGGGNQRQCHLDLQPAAVRRGDGRLPRRAGTRPQLRKGSLPDRLRRIVLREPGRHRDRQTTQQDRLGRGARAARQGGCRQRAPRLPTIRAGLFQRAVAGAGKGRGAPAAAAVGVYGRQGPGVLRHHVRDRSRRSRLRQHDAGGDDPGRVQPRDH